MFLNESYGAEKFKELDNVIKSEFDLVLCTLIESYLQILKDGVKTSHLEELIKNKLLKDYIRIIKHKYNIGHLGFEPEVATINSKYRNEGFIDIKVTNVVSKIFGVVDEELYFTIECKRLDMSAKKIDYYIKEGICRFVKGKYSKSTSFACMVGFIEKGEVNEIVSKLNLKLETIKKYNLEKLSYTDICLDFIHSYKSKHKRVKYGDIDLYHLIFDYTSIINT